MDSRIPDNAFEPPYPKKKKKGPGRTLGLGYDFVGKHIEIQLGRLAEMLGKGPRKTAIRIERHRSKAVGLRAGSWKIKDKNAKIEKNCSHLLRYVQSSVASTKLQALDHITRFAVEDQFVRNVLLAKDAVSIIDPLQLWDSPWADFSPTLLEIAAMIHESKFDYLDDQVRRFQSYFRDPDRAFLVVRHLERLHVSIPYTLLEFHLGNILLKFIADFDECFSRHFEWNVLGGVIAPIMELIVRYPERLPQTIGSNFFSWFSAFDNTEYDVNPRHAHLTYCLLLGIANANKLDTNDCLQFDSAELQGLYPHPAVQPLLYRLTCPPDILLGQIVAIRYQFKNSESLDQFLTPIVIESEELEYLCTQLSQYVDSEDELVCHRALHAFKYLLSTDIYCRRASFHALSTTRLAQTSDFWLLVEESEKKCIPAVDTSTFHIITRHCTDSGGLLHICDSYLAYCDGIEGTEQILEFSREGVLELHIPRGTCFSTAGHLPLLAGVTATGEKAYIARPVSKSKQYGDDIAVTEGTKPEDLRMWEYAPYPTKRKVVPLYLVVYVLRYALDAYMRCERFTRQASKSEAGLDATGPYSWKTLITDQEANMDSIASHYLEIHQESVLEEEEEVADYEVEESSIAEQETTDEEWETPDEWESVDITFE